MPSSGRDRDSFFSKLGKALLGEARNLLLRAFDNHIGAVAPTLPHLTDALDRAMRVTR